MNRRMRLWCGLSVRSAPAAVAALALVLTLCADVRGQEITAEQIDRAIERGVEGLLKAQRPDGSWGTIGKPGDYHYYVSGLDACAIMGLAYGDLPVSDERLQKGLKILLAAQTDRNYVFAVRTIALARLYPKLRREQQELVKQRIMADVEWFYKHQAPEGGWSYWGDGDGEFSNTQMALLALSEASNVLPELPAEVWAKALKRYLKWQRPDGGWNYGADSPVHRNMATYGSMTAAGVASLYIIRDKLYAGAGCPCRNGRSPRKGREAEIDAAIERATEWLKKNFDAEKNPGRDSYFSFWAFSCERVGLASGIKYFGTHNWYAELARNVLRGQTPAGHWGSAEYHTLEPETALAIAFLVKGRAPILFNKLQYKGEWNNHPRDLAHLCRYVGKLKEQPIQWQVVNLDVPVDELHDAPILYISAEQSFDLSAEHKKKLRQFTDTGGTVLFEAACANTSAAMWWEKTCKEIWPEWELKLVDKDHPLWTADQPLKGRLPVILGASDGVRTFLFYSKADISCPWNTEGLAGNKVLFDLGGNLYMYTTDCGKLRARLAKRETAAGPKYAGDTPRAGTKSQLSVARLKHGGQWYLGDNYRPWQLLAEALKEKAGVTLDVREAVQPGPDVPRVDLLHYTGRAGSDLGAEGAKWLKGYLAAGGFLFAEAAQGDPAFEPALKSTLDAAGLTLKPLPADSPLRTGQFGQAAGYNVAKPAFTHSLTPERIGKAEPELLGIHDGERLVGVYSPFDIMYSQTACKAFGSRGYAAEDARALAANIVLQLTAR